VTRALDPALEDDGHGIVIRRALRDPSLHLVEVMEHRKDRRLVQAERGLDDERQAERGDVVAQRGGPALLR